MSQFRPDAIVHLAARAGVRPSIEDPGLYADVNVLGTVHWLEAASRLEPRPRFVYASSSSVYGDRPDAPFRETDPVDLPISPYAATKKACELLAFTFHHLHGLPVTGLRFFTAYGPRNRPDLAIAKFTRLIDRGEPVPDVRRRHDPARLYLRRGHRRRDRPGHRSVPEPSSLQSGELRSRSSCKHLIDAIGAALGKTPVIQRLARAAGRRPPDLRRHQPSRGRAGLRPEDPDLRRAGAVRRLVSSQVQ